MKTIIPPYIVPIEGAEVNILEVSKNTLHNGKTFFIVTCYVEYKGFRSKTFSLTIKDNKELLSKLKVEIAKMKLMIYLGKTQFFEKI